MPKRSVKIPPKLTSRSRRPDTSPSTTKAGRHRALAQSDVTVLEAHYDDLVRDLNVTPRAISVSLYSSETYFDVTQAPAWSAALNDGKMRIPISGLTEVTPELSRVLKHELSHSFINQLTRGRCPQWLNEGVAQLMEGRSVARFGGAQLARIYAAHQQIPLNMLEGSWSRFDSMHAQMAYAEGLAAVEYVRDTYGVSDVQRILARIGDGSSTETSLRTTIHAGYGDMEDEIGYSEGKVWELAAVSSQPKLSGQSQFPKSSLPAPEGLADNSASCLSLRCQSTSAGHPNIGGLWALLSLGGVELDLIAFLQ